MCIILFHVAMLAIQHVSRFVAGAPPPPYDMRSSSSLSVSNLQLLLALQCVQNTVVSCDILCHLSHL